MKIHEGWRIVVKINGKDYLCQENYHMHYKTTEGALAGLRIVGSDLNNSKRKQRPFAIRVQNYGPNDEDKLKELGSYREAFRLVHSDYSEEIELIELMKKKYDELPEDATYIGDEENEEDSRQKQKRPSKGKNKLPGVSED